MSVDLNSRTYLQKLRREAEKREKEVANPYWRRAYIDLADAVDRLDAITARVEEKQT